MNITSPIMDSLSFQGNQSINLFLVLDLMFLFIRFFNLFIWVVIFLEYVVCYDDKDLIFFYHYLNLKQIGVLFKILCRNFTCLIGSVFDISYSACLFCMPRDSHHLPANNSQI
ncbi:hypothetical protein Hanom_Chr09g00781101 [Helianthus anomalus]